jgi:hypothetical protein
MESIGDSPLYSEDKDGSLISAVLIPRSWQAAVNERKVLVEV